MRLAILNWTSRRVGGAEVYLEWLLDGLNTAGVSLAFLHETAAPVDRELFKLPAGVEQWSVQESGQAATLKALREWKPDYIFNHGLTSPALEAKVIAIAPSVLAVHSYYGSCISGIKAFKKPEVRPCTRRFGVACLLHFYPRRCGGSNPVTLFQDFRRQYKRYQLHSRYRGFVVYSQHMASELIRNGIQHHRIRVLSYPTPKRAGRKPVAWQPRPFVSGSPWKLLFMGRMDRMKGGGVLLDALPLARAKLGFPLAVTFAGSGPCRSEWEGRARQLSTEDPMLSFEFNGWINDADIEAVFQNHHLLVIPSQWPEPSGIVGREAVARGMPVVAFAVGGIPEWCMNGVNGRLASGSPPTAEGLAEAIYQSIRNQDVFLELCASAAKARAQWAEGSHIPAVLDALGGHSTESNIDAIHSSFVHSQ